ncbi:RagB/SusD family nutrient uptake outer membrane protein [Croceivirga sp. JEA036]|uniref:RagB/SusD family nutrient uptake outer membrane protein n=1 Tax=Croceivirga sp. JEA036 TaxID=2721162 RepID=UPI0014387097|nr:RagB/SusD family nutrient uptake outer membrane protein [Croceivirga sp. JEA036]NJB35214.1 RagB/SusD family nutrient uptake outer membrane protein [Croceivirga sp. JEA036]
MRNLIKTGLLAVGLTALTFTSCDDDILVENPTQFLSPDALLVDRKGAETYLYGAYDAVQHIVSAGGQGKDGWGIHWGSVAADEVVFPPWAGDRKFIYLHQLTPSNNIVRKIWGDLYESLNRVNSTIDRVGAMTDDQIDAEDRAKFVAEARYLRSMVLFSLVSTWENPPLILEETKDLNNLEVTNATPQEFYTAIIADLQAAAAVLPDEQGAGRATKGAAQALLGKVYLQMTGFPLNQTDKFAAAEAVLSEVMNSGTYDLVPNYRDVFSLNNEQNQEMVYSIGMDGPSKNEGGLLSTFYGPNGNVFNGGGWGTCFINHAHEASYDREDIRLFNNVAKHNANQTDPEQGFSNPETHTVGMNTWRGWKWHAEKPNQYPNDTPFDNPYIRYADVLLMYAEAKNGQGTLTQADLDMTVNRLRARARMSETAVPDAVVGTVAENATMLLDERRKELCFEGWRRNDLIRFGVYKEAISGITQGGPNAGDPGPEFQDFEIRWPIPQSEMDINPNLVQNPGY